jgi:hypothetical protein
MKMLTLRWTVGGERFERVGALATTTPGVYLRPTRDKCADDCHDGFIGRACDCPVTFTWHLIAESGVLITNYLSREQAEYLAVRLGSTGMDFTVDREGLLAQTGSPGWKDAADLVREVRYG